MFIGYVFMTAFGVSLLLYRYVMAINISAWASALLVLTGWAMRRPQSVGRVTVTDSRACLFESLFLELSVFRGSCGRNKLDYEKHYDNSLCVVVRKLFNDKLWK